MPKIYFTYSAWTSFRDTYLLILNLKHFIGYQFQYFWTQIGHQFSTILDRIHSSSLKQIHCVKNIRVRSFSVPYFPAFGLNRRDMEYLFVFSPNAGKYGREKLRIRTLFKLRLLLPRSYRLVLTTKSSFIISSAILLSTLNISVTRVCVLV